MVENISIEYANAYAEVLEILNKMSKNDYNKIPREMIQVFEIYSNKEYAFEYDFKKDFDQQGISKRAKLILAILFRDYWANDNQREKIIAKQNYDRMKLEEKKKEKYNPDNIFNKKQGVINDIVEEHNVKEENMAIVKYKKQKWYQKIFDKILHMFRKK